MALVGSLSGSGGASNTINVTGSMIIANPGTGGLFPDFPGTDSVFFVSGAIGGKTAGTRTVSVFGGDTVISGSLTIGTGSVTITSNDITFRSTIGGSGTAKIFSGSSGLTFEDASGTRTLAQLIAGGGGTPGGSNTQVQFNDGGSFAGDADFVYDKTTHTLSVANLSVTGSGVVSLTGDLKVGGNDIQASDGTVALTLSATSGDVTIGGDLTVTGNDIKANGGTTALTLNGANVTTAGSLTVTGDLTVNGTTTTIDTTNLLVEDPIILMASGAAGPNRNGGIAIFSGSADTTAPGARTELVFGRVANDTWGAGKINTNNGTSTDLTSMFLLPVRASSFQVGGSTAYLSSSDGVPLLLDAGTGTIEIGTSNNAKTVKIGTGVAAQTVTIGSQNTTSALTLFAGSGSLDVNSTGPITIDSSGDTIGIGTDAVSQNINIGTAGNRIITIGASGGTTGVALIAGSGGAKVGTDPIVTLAATQTLTNKTLTRPKLNADGSTIVSIDDVNGNELLKFPGSAVASAVNEITVTNAATGQAPSIASTGGDANVGLSIVTKATGNLSLDTGTTGAINVGTNANAKTVTVGNATGASQIVLNAGSGRIVANQDVLPGANNTYDLGSTTARWRNMYTGDLHLRNERGDWTIIEEEEFLTITNNKNGKRYKFCLEEI